MDRRSLNKLAAGAVGVAGVFAAIAHELNPGRPVILSHSCRAISIFGKTEVKKNICSMIRYAAKSRLCAMKTCGIAAHYRSKS
jgi:hypothetical protein